MLTGLTNLRMLLLQANDITTLEPGSFRDLTSLAMLYLYENSLQSLSECIFDPNNHPQSLNYFEIYLNPLSCTQHLCWLKQADTTWITVPTASVTMCVEPAALNGRTWDILTEYDLNCSMPGGFHKHRVHKPINCSMPGGFHKHRGHKPINCSMPGVINPLTVACQVGSINTRFINPLTVACQGS